MLHAGGFGNESSDCSFRESDYKRMSYILDALKKLETERERKARAAGMVNIAGELLKNSPAPPKPRRNWPLVLGLVLLASLLTFGATFLFLHEGKGKRHRTSRQMALQTPQVPVTAAKLPILPSPAPAPVAKQPAAATPRPAAPLTAQTPSAGKARNTGKASSPPGQSQVTRPAKPAATPAAGESAPAEPARPAAVSLVPAPADIKVSGIAWQDRRTASRAVVNGFLLREGDTVSGARIVEIYQNRVRFSSSAGTFEVYLVATGLPGPPK